MRVLEEAERQRRRASNIIWNAAGSYEVKPVHRAYDENGRADLYMNSVIGAAYKYYDFAPIVEFFESLGAGEQAEEYSELIWLGLEGAVVARACAERPALYDLRRAYAKSVLKLLERQEIRGLDELERLHRAHWLAALGETMELTERERKIIAELTFSPEMDAAEIAERSARLLRDYYNFTPRRELRRALRLPSWLKPRRVQYLGLGVYEDEEESESLTRLKALLRGERAPTDMQSYLERCFGLPMFGPETSADIENELCRGAHAECRLHFTRGEFGAEPITDTETALQRRVLATAREQNRAAYMSELPRNQTAVRRLAERIRNCLLVYLDPAPVKARAGELNASRVWRAVQLGDSAVFTRPQRGEIGGLSVDILLDGSASQRDRQERVAVQGRIIAESLTLCGLPVRVSSYCTIEGSTILRVFRDYNETRKNDEIFAYSAEGWNRDSLALRAAGRLIDSSGETARLLIILSDVRPNDPQRMGGRGGPAYRGESAVADLAAEVEALRRRGIAVICVFTGDDPDLPNARQVFGRSLARIRSLTQFAETVGGLIQEAIRGM